MKNLKKLLLYFIIFIWNIIIEPSTVSSSTTIAVPTATNQSVTWPQASVVTMINNLASQSYLPYPYSSLQQDPTSATYVLVSSTAGTYTFFSVPNNFTDANNNPIPTGAVYDNQGNLQNVIQGTSLSNLLIQSGISIDSTGKQYLGICSFQPLMLINTADTTLKPGTSGVSMIYSSDPSFPCSGITSPVNYNNSKFYFYYNTLMQTYFVMTVIGNSSQYININNGCIYNLDGSNAPTINPVGTTTGTTTNNFFLPYLNTDNYLQCIMMFSGNNATYSDFKNTETSFQANIVDPSTNQQADLNALTGLSSPYNNVNVYQMPIPATTSVGMPDLSIATQYNVYWNPPTATVYKINSVYGWQNLQIVPIDMNSRALLTQMPDPSYTRIAIMLENNNFYACVFAGKFYTGASSGTNIYTLNSGTNQIKLSILVDPKTNIKYVSITSGLSTYNYQYSFAPLTTFQLQNYQSNAWQVGQTVNAAGNNLLVKSLPVNSAGNVNLTSITLNNIQGLPTDSTIQNNMSSNISTIAQDVTNNRFLTMVYPSGSSQTPTYSYITQNCYVDLSNGVLFTTQGVPTGQALQTADLIALLNQLSLAVTIVYNKAVLSYSTNSTLPTTTTTTSTQAPQTQITTLQQQNTSLQTDITNRQNDLKTQIGNSAAVTSRRTADQNAITKDQAQIAANNQLIAASQAQTNAAATPTATTSTSATTSSTNSATTTTPATVTNPQVISLQQQNTTLQTDITARQKNLNNQTGNSPAVTSRKTADQNAITKDQEQIKYNNTQIAQLASTSSTTAGERSTILGKLSSEKQKMKKRKKYYSPKITL